MNPGELRHKITIQAPNGATQNEAGEDVPAYIDFAKVSAKVEPLQGRQLLESKKLKPEKPYKIKIRYRKGVDSGMQVLYGGKVLDVDSVVDVEEKHQEMLLYCFEKVKQWALR